MSSPFYFQESEESRLDKANNPATPSFASSSKQAQPLIPTAQRDLRLRTTTADSTLAPGASPYGLFSSVQTPYLYKHTNQTPRGYEAQPRQSTSTNDHTSTNTPLSFTPFLANRAHHAAPFFDPSSPFSQPHDFEGASTSRPGGAPSDLFRSGGANMRARLFQFREGAATAEDAALNSSPGGLGAGIFVGGGTPSATSLRKQRQQTASRPQDENMHSSPVRVVDPRELSGRDTRSRSIGGAFGGGADNDEDDDEDMGRVLGEAEMSFVGFGVSPVKHPSAERGGTEEWPSMGAEGAPFGGEDSRMFWDEMATSESVELPFGSVRAERGLGRNMVNEAGRMMGAEMAEQEEQSRREGQGAAATNGASRPSGPPSANSMHIRNLSDDTNHMGSSPTRGSLRHQRSFHTRVRSDETSSMYHSYDGASTSANEQALHPPSTPPHHFVPTLFTTDEPVHSASNLSPRRPQQHHHQAREIPSPIAANSTWTFPSDILAAGAAAVSKSQDEAAALEQQPQQAVRRRPSSYAHQLYSQQQIQYQQQQMQGQIQQLESNHHLHTIEAAEGNEDEESEEDQEVNTPLLDAHTDRSPTFSPQIGTPASRFENTFESQQQHQVQLQQQQPLQHPLHSLPGFMSHQQQGEQGYLGQQQHYEYSRLSQEHQREVPPPTYGPSSSLSVPQHPSSFQHQNSFLNHRRVTSFDADASPELNFSPQLDQSPMFAGQPFAGARGAGDEDHGLTDLLMQAKVHQAESMNRAMELISDRQSQERAMDRGRGGSYGLGIGESVFDANLSRRPSGTSQSSFRAQMAGRPFPSVLTPAEGNPTVGLPSGFHPSTSQLPSAPTSSLSDLPRIASRLPPSFTSTTGPMANRPPNAVPGRRPKTPVIPEGHDPSYNTFDKGLRIAPLVDDSSYATSSKPSSGKALSGKAALDRQVPRGFPLSLGLGTRMRPGPKAKSKTSRSKSRAVSTVAGEESPFAFSAEAGPSSAPIFGVSLEQQQQQRPASSSQAPPSSLITTAPLGQLQKSFGPDPTSQGSPSEHGEDELATPAHSEASDDESVASRPTITTELIDSLYTIIRVGTTSNTKRVSVGSAGGTGDEEFGKSVPKRKGRKVDVKYRCLVAGCERFFPRKSAIVNHIQTHLEDKPFNCSSESCDASFVRQHDLRRHERIHSGTKPFPCICGKGFARGDALMRHRQRGICAGSIVPLKVKGE